MTPASAILGSIFLSLVFLTVALVGVWGGLKWRAQKTREEFTRAYGSQIRIMSGCGVIKGMNRVPGILALTDDRILFRALILGERGEILLQDVAGVTLEKTSTTRHWRARKYIGASVMEITFKEGRSRIFVLDDQKASEWKSLLDRFFLS